jgi:hypothetical protein
MGPSRHPVADGRMTPVPIVKDFDVLEQGRLGLSPGPEACKVNQLGLERPKAILVHGTGSRISLVPRSV